jgi:mRNA interferase MazF
MVDMIRRGEIWVADLNANKGKEIGKVRPVLVMQEDRLLSDGLPAVLAVPLTTQFRPSFEALRIRIAARDRLLRDSFVVIEQLRSLDRSRFSEGPLTMLDPGEMAAVEKALMAMLGMW